LSKFFWFCGKVIAEPRLFVERKAGAFLTNGVKKAILLFSVLFLTWQVLYFVALIFPTLNEYWLFAYLAVFAVAICFFVLDKQRVRDLGFTKPKAWRYIAVGFVFAVVYNVYWAVVGAPIFSTGSIQVIQHGIFSVPYNLLFALIVGLVEETSFRGYILRNLNTAFSSTKAIVYSSILFGLYHLSLVGVFWSTTSGFETVSYWTLVVLAAVLIGFFLGYFYIGTEQTTIGTITYHSSSIFLESLVPFSLATSWLNGHLLSTTVYIMFIPILILLRRKGWLSNTNR
jgi:membrane protease YdiL (CAAX protease family)